MPLFSIIVPCYNVEQYLEKCIRSIIGQSYKDFELILIDDGSPDNCGIICDRFAASDSRIRVIHQDNRGLSAARNAGMSIASGRYFWFVDSDDCIEDDALNILSGAIEKSSADVIIFGYSTINNGNIKKYSLDDYFVNSMDIKIIKESFISDNFGSHVWNKCMNRMLFIGKEFPVGQIYEDLYLIPRVIYDANSIFAINCALYNYNQDNVSSITSSLNSKKRYDLFLAKLKMYEFALENNLQCTEFCRWNAIEQAQETVCQYFRDGIINEEQVNFAERYCTSNMVDSLRNYERASKCFRKAAEIAYKKREFSVWLRYMLKYISRKISE